MRTHSASTALPDVWHLPFDLAWEALQAGSRPIGAVLVDADGRIVATGRNRSQEPTGPKGQLAGIAIAHAEINVLAQLPTGRRYEDHRLYATLEPCLLCSGALIHSHVGAVAYAAPDTLWRGIEDIPRVGGLIAKRWARREGPADGPASVFAAMLAGLWHILHDPSSNGPGAACSTSLTLAHRLLDIEGFLDAETAQVAYRLALPHSGSR
ncbi:nucleoside deaminase [Streptomyces sp. NPDC017964]|uniref:nucleoside deaminase n=1 Tax=Streptomyces sp. NPDC017964 TaxID=3365022 RepID=UPI003795A96F